jgi:ABC-type amino acid transport substrate-binding protein
LGVGNDPQGLMEGVIVLPLLEAVPPVTPDPVLYGALQYFISKRYARVLEMPQGLLAPAYMAIALPEHSPLKKPIDRALIKITNSSEWRALEERFFVR